MKPISKLRMLASELNQIEVSQDLPFRCVPVFFEVARSDAEGGITVTELSKQLDISQASTSRMISLLDEATWKNRPGAGLIRSISDPHDSRRRVLRLSDKGARMIQRLSDIVGD
jgi:hypothetical protein